MKSEIAKRLDNGSVLESNIQAKEMPMDENMELERQYKIFKRIRNQKAKNGQGGVK